MKSINMDDLGMHFKKMSCWAWSRALY